MRQTVYELSAGLPLPRKGRVCARRCPFGLRDRRGRRQGRRLSLRRLPPSLSIVVRYARQQSFRPQGDPWARLQPMTMRYAQLAPENLRSKSPRPSAKRNRFGLSASLNARGQRGSGRVSGVLVESVPRRRTLACDPVINSHWFLGRWTVRLSRWINVRAMLVSTLSAGNHDAEWTSDREGLNAESCHHFGSRVIQELGMSPQRAIQFVRRHRSKLGPADSEHPVATADSIPGQRTTVPPCRRAGEISPLHNRRRSVAVARRCAHRPSKCWAGPVKPS
jgi:hypothetical protein